MKIRPVGAEFFHMEGRMAVQTDRHDEANSRFSKFCESRLKTRQVYQKTSLSNDTKRQY